MPLKVVSTYTRGNKPFSGHVPTFCNQSFEKKSYASGMYLCGKYI